MKRRSLLGTNAWALVVSLVLSAIAIGEPGKRPENWARPMKMEGVPNLHQVNRILYRSAQPSEEGMENLHQAGIKTVINLRSFNSDRDEIGDLPLNYERITMKAWHPEEKEVVHFLKIISDPNNAPVLVHCHHGADRTGTMCAIYRIFMEGWTKEQAIREMKDGNYGFHEIWANLPRWIRDLDVAEIRKQAGLEPAKP